jgi:glycosyltransferase involved in cell wall biosynthesis
MKTDVKNILLVGNWSSDTGYAWWLMETFWLAIAARFRDRCRVIVCYPQVTTLSPRLSAANLEVVQFDFDKARPAQLASFMRDNQIGCVYLTDKKYVSWQYCLLRAVGVRRIILHDHMPGTRSAPTPLKRLLKSTAALAPALTADAYIAVSDQILQRFVDVACLPRHKCHLARNGIDVSRIADAQPGSIRSELGIAPDSILIVSSGRLTHYKGIQSIIEAANALINERGLGQVFFAHCGDGPDRAAFAGLIERFGLQRHFFLLGMRSDIPAILQSADIAVHASKGEGLSLSILEFMAAGLPVVVSDDPTVSQTVINNVTGLHFKTGDSADLASKLQPLVQSKELQSSLGKRAAREVKEHYSLDQTVAAVLSVFDKTLVPQAAG